MAPRKTEGETVDNPVSSKPTKTITTNKTLNIPVPLFDELGCPVKARAKFGHVEREFHAHEPAYHVAGTVLTLDADLADELIAAGHATPADPTLDTGPSPELADLA